MTNIKIADGNEQSEARMKFERQSQLLPSLSNKPQKKQIPNMISEDTLLNRSNLDFSFKRGKTKEFSKSRESINLTNLEEGPVGKIGWGVKHCRDRSLGQSQIPKPHVRGFDK